MTKPFLTVFNGKSEEENVQNQQENTPANGNNNVAETSQESLNYVARQNSKRLRRLLRGR